MARLPIIFDGRGLVDESYKDGSGSEDGIYQADSLALWVVTV